jgi:ubiquinone/menaquinone biosynthesis C-methylase UbiE
MNQIQSQGCIYGIDLSRAMIDEATQQAQALGHTNVMFRQGDTECLAFPVAFFHLVMSNLTFHFVPNKARALQEVYRVLVPRGHVAFSFLGDLHVRAFYEMYERVRGRYVEYQLPRLPPTPFLSLDETYELFDTAGFRDLQISALHQLVYADPRQMLSAWGHNYWKLDRSPQEVHEVTTALTREIAHHTTEKGFKLNRYTIFAHGSK